MLPCAKDDNARVTVWAEHVGKELAARRQALERSATEAFGFPLRVFQEDLQGPDPHAFPDVRPMAAIATVACFIGADGATEEGGALQRCAMATCTTGRLANRTDFCEARRTILSEEEDVSIWKDAVSPG